MPLYESYVVEAELTVRVRTTEGRQVTQVTVYGESGGNSEAGVQVAMAHAAGNAATRLAPHCMVTKKNEEGRN